MNNWTGIGRSRRWHKEEVDDLIRLYNEIDNEALMDYFNRSYLSIYKKAWSIGLRKTKDMAFINRSKGRGGEQDPNWKGGRKKTNKGYIVTMKKGHPRATVDGYVMEHIVIMEECLGRFIGVDEVVHHINGIKDDNRVSNLEVMGFGEHTRHHHLGSKRSARTRELISQKARERHRKNKKDGVINE